MGDVIWVYTRARMSVVNYSIQGKFMYLSLVVDLPNYLESQPLIV